MTEISKDTIALVTGASRGLGYASAIELARKGIHVIALARTVGGLEELADEIEAVGGTSTLVPLDITDEEGLQRMCLSIFERWGRIDLLVHCAAHAEPLSPVAHVSEKNLDRCWQVNARATQRLIAMVEPLLKASNIGKAVFISDEHNKGKFFTAYRASKAAAEVIVENWKTENLGLSLDISIFSPDPMPSALRARFYPGENKEKLSPSLDEAVRLVASI